MIKRKRLKRFLMYIILILIFIIYFTPLYWIVSTSFKLEKDTLEVPPKLVFRPTLVNYIEAFTKSGISSNFKNSILIAAVSTVLALLVGTPAAYAMSRYKFKRKGDLFFWFLSTRMAPPVLAAIPFFILSRSWGFYDTKILLILVYMLMNLAWVVWMMRSFFDEIPNQIDEAAMVDGCTRGTVLIRVIVPLARPGLIATTIFCLILAWNEYFFALVLTSVNAGTLPKFISTFLTVHGLLWGQMCAAGTIIMLPILVFILFVQRHLIRGLTMGAMKG